MAPLVSIWKLRVGTQVPTPADRVRTQQKIPPWRDCCNQLIFGQGPRVPPDSGKTVLRSRIVRRTAGTARWSVTRDPAPAEIVCSYRITEERPPDSYCSIFQLSRIVSSEGKVSKLHLGIFSTTLGSCALAVL